MDASVVRDEGSANEALDERRAALRSWMASGKPLPEYCRESGQSYWALRRWRLKYAEELGIEIQRRPGAVKNAITAAKRAASACVPIVLQANTGTASSSRVEIRLRGERTLVVDAGIDGMALSRLVNAIERAA